jgi:nucleoside-diphosphate-sugar epimerase
LVVPDVFNPRYSYGGGKIITELMAVNNAKFFERMMIFRPHNIYGPDMGHEHVIPQLINKAKNKPEFLEIQGDGSDTRAFCYIEDFIDGLMILLEKGQHNEIYNIGTEEEVSIYKLACKIADYFDIKTISFVKNVKGGTNRRCPDITKLKKLGFSPKISLTDGLKRCMV